MDNKIFVIVLVILAIFSALALLTYLPHQYDASKEPQMANFPQQVGEWQGKDIAISERDYAILATKNLIVREYSAADKPPVMLYVIYSGDSRKSLHPPEICYTGGGGTIIEKSVIPLTAGIKANKFVIESKAGRQLVTYWFRSGNLNTPNYFEQQLRTAMQKTAGKQPSGAMLRISMNIAQGKDNEALGHLKAFTRQIEPLLAQYVP